MKIMPLHLLRKFIAGGVVCPCPSSTSKGFFYREVYFALFSKTHISQVNGMVKRYGYNIWIDDIDKTNVWFIMINKKEEGIFMATETVKSTVNLTKYYKEQLEYLVKIKELESVTEGINLAIEYYVKAKQKELYAAAMKKAASDEEFIKRTMGSQRDFEKSDAETEMMVAEDEAEW